MKFSLTELTEVPSPDSSSSGDGKASGASTAVCHAALTVDHAADVASICCAKYFGLFPEVSIVYGYVSLS